MKHLLYQQLDDLLTKPASRTALGCERALRVGAATLCRAPLGEITATTVVCNIADDDIDAVESLVADIADEYGLDASIQQKQQLALYSVRFCRPQATTEAVQPLTSARTLLNRLVRH